MKVFYLGQPLVFDCVPRKYPQIGESVTLVLRDELNRNELEQEVTWESGEKLRITLQTQPDGVASRQKFEIELKINSDLIYQGNLIFLDNGTDIQNYSNEQQSTSKYQFRE